MSGKSSAGFTKSANQAKFVRNRDVKLKDKEIRKENNVAKVMSEGICRKCRDKVQWRFKFDKYKPLKRPGNCQECRQKTVTKAYRNLCDECAHKKKVCPACCSASALLESMKSEAEENEAKGDGNDFIGGQAVEMIAEDEHNEEGEECNEDDDGEGDNQTITSNVDMDASIGAYTVWNESKFQSIASNKYNKDRNANEFLTNTQNEKVKPANEMHSASMKKMQAQKKKFLGL